MAACLRRSMRSGRASAPLKATRSGLTSNNFARSESAHGQPPVLPHANTDDDDEGPMAEAPRTPIEIGLTAAIVTVVDDEPLILVAGEAGRNEPRAGLAFGPFDPLVHRTFEIGLRSWAEAQTGLRVGYVEQLYTFGDRGRHARLGDTGRHVVSIGYLALTRMPEGALQSSGSGFEPWYRFFPWEDFRSGRPAIVDAIIPLLEEWSHTVVSEPGRPLSRRERLRVCFATGGSPWDEEKTLDR